MAARAERTYLWSARRTCVEIDPVRGQRRVDGFHTAWDGASVTRDGAYVSERVGAAVTVGVIVLVVGAIVGAS